MGLIEWIGAILGGIAINLIANELFAWGPRFSEWLTRWAVWRLPVEMQERLREEWSAHLDALHPVSRTLAAIGFVLAAYRVKVSFDREAKGALGLREWLALKPIVVVVMNERGAMSLARTLGEVLDLEDPRLVNIDFGDRRSVNIGPEDVLVRSNLMAQAKAALHRLRKRALRLYSKELQPKANNCTNISRMSSGDIAVESADGVLMFRFRRTILR